LKLGPAETLNVARRQVDALVARRIGRTRTRIAPHLARIGTSGGDAIATYFAILDGHTLNLQAVLPPLGGLDRATAEVVLRKGRTERQVPAVVRADSDGHRYVEATAVLGSPGGRVPLSRGVWQVRVVVTASSGTRHRIAVHRLVPPAPPRGATIADPACPDTGVRYRAVTSSLGACRIAVRPGKPAAEVDRVLVDSGGAEILGRFVGVADPAGAVAEFRRCGDGAVRTAPVTVRGAAFAIATPLAAMVPAAGVADVWEIRVRFAGDRRLPVGRLLHDLRNVRKTVRAVERQMLVPGLPMFHLRPQYSNAGRLTLTFSSVDHGEQV
jgi:hypothetical protein